MRSARVAPATTTATAEEKWASFVEAARVAYTAVLYILTCQKTQSLSDVGTVYSVLKEARQTKEVERMHAGSGGCMARMHHAITASLSRADKGPVR